MYCIRPRDSDSEPEFETVNLPSPPRHPAIEKLTAEPNHALGIVAANSSPKLRLTFDEYDTFMTDEEVERIGSESRQNLKLATSPATYPNGTVESRQTSPLLPPTPSPHAREPGRDSGGDGQFHHHSHNHHQDRGSGRHHVATLGHAHNQSHLIEGSLNKLDVPIELQHQLSRLGLQQPQHMHHISSPESKVYNCGSGTDTADATKVPIQATHPQTMKKLREKLRPRPLSILPRLGTLTALPGSKMEVDNSATGGGDSYDEEYIDPDTDQTSSRKSTTVRIPARTSSLYAPSPVPWTPASTSTPTKRANPASVSAPTQAKIQSRPESQAHQPIAATASKSNFHLHTESNEINSNGHNNHKRKISLSAPFTNNFKRILTHAGAGKRRKHNITHLTHEATAGNRTLGRDVDRAVNKIRNTGEGDSMETSMASPASAQSESSTATGTTILGPTTATATAVHMTPRRDLVTPIFAGPSDTVTSTPASSTTSSTPATHPLRAATSLFRHRNAPSISTAFDPTSKSALHNLIIQLRSQISDLTLENQVLKDQIAIVRKDWIDTSGELEVERHRAWEGEMERFRLGVKVEELRGEVRMLTREKGQGDERE